MLSLEPPADDALLVRVIRENSRPMDPLPTDVEPRLASLPGIRAVLFDVYGTLVTSGSGDVGTARESGRGSAYVEALNAVGIEFEGDADDAVGRFIETIREHQRSNPAEYPEVDIVAVWDSVAGAERDAATLRRLAVEYEVRVNPVWPMPRANETLASLRSAGLLLGIVSNAQFFTPLLFPALFDASLDELGFDPAARLYSFEHLRAKPGTYLYERAVEAVAAHGIGPPEVLYVGNDLLNDVTPAAAVGFRTALFAGDARSLRLREGDDRVAGVEPDLVVTDLAQLVAAVVG